MNLEILEPQVEREVTDRRKALIDDQSKRKKVKSSFAPVFASKDPTIA